MPFKPQLAFLLLTLTTAAASAQSFEVATVKLSPPSASPDTGQWSLPSIGRFWARNLPLTNLMQLAYGIDMQQIANAPAWFASTLYDIEAKPEDGVKMSREELKPRLQALLAQRFHLVTHHETRFTPGYFLVVAKHGQHLTPATPGHTLDVRYDVSQGTLQGYNWSMAYTALMLTPKAGKPVVDHTGLTGRFDIALKYAPDATADTDLPSLFTALRDTLGLELQSAKVPSDTIVIDHIDRIPTEN